MPTKITFRKSSHILNFSHFFPKNVIAFVSTRTINFSRRDDRLSLTQRQKNFLKAHTGIPIQRLPNIKQIHGKCILLVNKNQKNLYRMRKADGLITQDKDIPLTVRTADCLSVFMFDGRTKTIGLVHAGWRGSRKRIAQRAIHVMKEHFKISPKDLKVVLGPVIRPCCYRVGEEFKRYFPRETIKKPSGYYLDLPSVNKRQLMKAGVKEKNIFDCGICTSCERRFFSYRREGRKAGRMISLMMLKTS